MVTRTRTGFGVAFLGGLTELGPFELFSGDLSLELGLSIWLCRSRTSLLEARQVLLSIRRVVLEVCGMDPAIEPVPFVGRSPKLDVINLVAYVEELLRRGSATSGCSVPTVVERVIAQLPGPMESALGA
jgi:hypothetical protein